MHTPGKGMSSSALPYKRSPPSWLKTTAAEVRARCRWTRIGQAAARAAAQSPRVKDSGCRLLRRAWLPPTPQVQELICKFSKKGMTPSQIGVLLRDNHGIAQVSTVTGSKVLRILKGQGARVGPEQRLAERAAAVHARLGRNAGGSAIVCDAPLHARVC